jgi:hypothetical protein
VASFDPDALFDPNSHLVPDILGASIAKQPGGSRARSTARGRPRNTWGARQHGLGLGSTSIGKQKGAPTRNSHLLPVILGATVAKQTEGCRARSTAHVGSRNTPWPRQRGLGLGSTSIRKQKGEVSMHFRPEMLTCCLLSWEQRSQSRQEGAGHVLQPMWALETLPGHGSAAWVSARPRSGNKKVKSLSTIDTNTPAQRPSRASVAAKASRSASRGFSSPCGP